MNIIATRNLLHCGEHVIATDLRPGTGMLLVVVVP